MKDANPEAHKNAVTLNHELQKENIETNSAAKAHGMAVDVHKCDLQKNSSEKNSASKSQNQSADRRNHGVQKRKWMRHSIAEVMKKAFDGCSRELQKIYDIRKLHKKKRMQIPESMKTDYYYIHRLHHAMRMEYLIPEPDRRPADAYDHGLHKRKMLRYAIPEPDNNAINTHMSRRKRIKHAITERLRPLVPSLLTNRFSNPNMMSQTSNLQSTILIHYCIRHIFLIPRQFWKFALFT